MISKDRVSVGKVGALPRTPIWDDAFTNGGWSMMPEIVSVLHDGSIEAKWASVDWYGSLALSFSFKEQTTIFFIIWGLCLECTLYL